MIEKLKRADIIADRQIKFQAYGVNICVESKRAVHLEAAQRQLKKVFPGGLEKTAGAIDFRFFIRWTKKEGYELYRNDEKVNNFAEANFIFEALESQVRLTIAEFAGSRVFLHAGVVGWKGRAIVIPASSWSGKTTLVAELVKRGAAYYSDEYAVLDADGNVQPFPKWLSIRSRREPFEQTDQPVESLGGVAGSVTIPVGMVLIARFDQGKKMPRRWQPRRLSQGQGMMEILRHTMPIRNKPEFVLEVLNKLTARAIIVKTVRGEAAEFAETLLNYFECQFD